MSQKIVRGIESIKKEIVGKKFLLVKDSSYSFLDIKTFFENTSHIVFSDFTPNPLYEQVVEGVKRFNDNHCELIVAIGGGSAIDVAKCIKLYCKMNHSVHYLQQKMFDSKIPLIAIPTTAGTGSESTCHAVIYYENVKQSISHPSIVPNIAVLEPSVLKTLPVYQKKCTMLDAFCQAIESWWSVNSTDESKEYSYKAIELIRDNWEAYIKENTLESAEKIMLAANYAGRAINITATTAAHAMSYKITFLYGFPHGHAVAVCLPLVWRYMLNHMEKCADTRGQEYLQTIFDKIIVDVDWFEELMKKLEMERPVSKNRKEDIEVLSESVNPIRLKNNPVSLEKEAIKSIYEEIIQ